MMYINNVLKEGTLGDYSQSAPGLLRLVWWKETINKFLDNKVVPAHPIGRAFLGAMIQHDLSKMWVTSLLNARISDVETLQFASLEDLEKFADKTAGSVFRLVLECVYSSLEKENKGLSNDVKSEAEHCASHLGRAVGLATLLRASSYHLSNRKCYFPIELLNLVCFIFIFIFVLFDHFAILFCDQVDDLSSN